MFKWHEDNKKLAKLTYFQLWWYKTQFCDNQVMTAHGRHVSNNDCMLIYIDSGVVYNRFNDQFSQNATHALGRKKKQHQLCAILTAKSW